MTVLLGIYYHLHCFTEEVKKLTYTNHVNGKWQSQGWNCGRLAPESGYSWTIMLHTSGGGSNFWTWVCLFALRCSGLPLCPSLLLSLPLSISFFPSPSLVDVTCLSWRLLPTETAPQCLLSLPRSDPRLDISMPTASQFSLTPFLPNRNNDCSFAVPCFWCSGTTRGAQISVSQGMAVASLEKRAPW